MRSFPAAGICHQPLQVIHIDDARYELPPHHERVIPGHEIVGRVDSVGAGVTAFSVGQRAGIAWLRHTCGVCRFCRRGAENLCIDPGFTGWDADGGYAEYTVADERFCFPIPAGYSDLQAAPLLCAGLIGYRALRMCGDAHHYAGRLSGSLGGRQVRMKRQVAALRNREGRPAESGLSFLSRKPATKEARA